MVKGCLFCAIVEGKIPSFKVYEDKGHLAILDIFPNTYGMTLLLTKKHYDSYIFDMPQNAYFQLMKAAVKVGKKLDKNLKVKRTAIVMEGMGINHAHIKFYPLHGLENKFKEIWAKTSIYFKKYKGYLSTQLGPRADEKQLQRLAKKLKK